MRVKLRERRDEAPETMTFVFDLGGQEYKYAAGQYAFFELDELKFDDPRGKRRHFTLSSSPTESGVVQFTTKLRGFGLKETLRHADLGLEVSLEPPRGNFVLPEDKMQPSVFLGGGIGITPFRSMMRRATDERLPTPITLLYSAQVPEGLVFRREFEQMPQENQHLKIITTITSPEKAKDPWMGETGLIDAAKIRAHVDDIASAIFYSCGPPPMVQAMQDLLKGMNIAADHIRVERFTGY